MSFYRSWTTPGIKRTIDLPLCSPRNTNLNFRRGLPKSPEVDIPILNIKYFKKIPQTLNFTIKYHKKSLQVKSDRSVNGKRHGGANFTPACCNSQSKLIIDLNRTRYDRK